MKKLFITLIVSVLFVTGISSQSIANYTFNSSPSVSLQDMSGGTTQLIGPSARNAASGITDIGFSFYFMGVQYTQFSVNSNGQMGLGGNVFFGDGITNAAANAPLLVPVSGTNTLLSTGKVHYRVTGTAPNRILIVEWKDLLIPTPVVNTDPPMIDTNPNQIQVFLHESTGIIEFKYGLINYTSVPATTRSTFISSGNTATTVKSVGSTLNSANDAFPVGTYAMTSTTTNLLNNRTFSFTPPQTALAAPVWDSTTPFRLVTTTGLTMYWLNKTTAHTSIDVYRSDDAGLNYVFVAKLNTFDTNFAAILPFPGTSSLWKVAAVNEGKASFSTANTPLSIPTVSVIDCSGSSTLTASNYSGDLLWSTGEITPSIVVTANGTYSVTQTIAGLASVAGSGIATPVPTISGPVDPVTLLPATLSGPTSGQSYTTEKGMNSYEWTVSSGGVIRPATQGTDSVVVDWTTVGGQKTVSVRYKNPGCANFTPLAVLIINYYPYATNIDATTIPQFVDPMPHFAAGLRVNAKGGGDLLIKTVKVQQVALSTGTIVDNGKIGDPATPSAGLGNYAAYQISYKGGKFGPAMWPAQTIEAERGNELRVQYVNELVGVRFSDFNILADQTLMMNGYDFNGSDPLIDPYTGDIPMVVHLHGGEMPSNSDGGPTAWFMPTGNDLKGPGFKFNASSLSTYPNKQEAATLWYHPHDQGLTRINVYTGLAGYYFLRDSVVDNLAKLPGWSGDDKVQEVTPAGKTTTFNKTNAYLPEIELAVQDRMFNTKGELYWPVAPTNPDLHPFWTPEFFGDVMTVNGKSWPYLSVAPRKYRFRMLDGCNARFLNMWLMNLANSTNGPKITVVGTDGGLLDTPVDLDPASGKTVFMAPGERLDVVIDFSGVAPGTVLTLMNDAAAPYPTGTPVTAGLTDRIMQFVVNGILIPADGSSQPKDKSLILEGANLRPSNPMVKLTDFAGKLADGVKPVIKRQILLNEVSGPGGPAQVLFNNSHFDEGAPSVGTPQGFGGPTEMPKEGTTELFSIINTTIDAHPIHIHLLQWQLVSRHEFNRTDYLNSYYAAWAKHVPSIPIWPAGLGYPGGAGSPYRYDSLNADGAVGGNPAITPYLTGPVIPANPEENGWKDDIKALPGQVSTYVVRVAPTDRPINASQADLMLPFDPSIGPGYVWHCHIIDHEDMDMMRPLLIKPSQLRYPKITTQPKIAEVCSPSSVVFAVSATTPAGSVLKYQWQLLTAGTWNDLQNVAPYTGALSASLTVAVDNTLTNGNKYRVVLTNDAGSTTSNEVALNIITGSSPLANVVINASANSVFAGQQVTLTAVPTNGGTDPSYEWFKGAASVATTPTYTYVPQNSSEQVTVKLTSSAGCISVPVTSQPVSITVTPASIATGEGTSDWNDAATWPLNTIPSVSTDVVIPLGKTVTINKGNAICKSLVVEGTLTRLPNVYGNVPGIHMLTISGDLIVDGALVTDSNTVVLNGSTSGLGTINAALGTLVYGGSVAQTVSTIDSTAVVNNIIINNKAGVTLPTTLTVNSTLTINAGAKLTNPDGAILTVKNVTINTDIPLGPGTFVDKGNTYTNTGGVSTVQQYLTGGRNWYISSPVTTATPGSLTTASSVYNYNEPTTAWILESSALSVLKGYAAGVQSTGTVTFTGGALNTGAPENSWLTSSGGAKSGYNLVGNPYPSYLNFDLVNASSTNLESTMWYRTKNTGNTAYVFDTYNAASGVGTGNNGVNVTSLIPPVQSFWVRVANGFNSGILGVNNSMRSHADLTTNRLKVKGQANSGQQLLRLQVSNGVNSDQAVVLFNAKASNGFDSFDSEKMSNNLASVPEIYTLAGTEPLVINGLNSISSNEELPLGFTSGEGNTFTIKATEINNFDPDLKIILKDKMLNTEKELVIGNDYSFTSDAISTSTRFSILFKTSTVITGAINPDYTGSESLYIFKNQNNQITIHRNDPIGEGTVTVYNATGQKIVNIPTTGVVTLVNNKLLPGVYMVTVNAQGKNTTKKITL